MAGFKRNAPTLVLTFTGELSGLEVETRTVGRRQYRELSELHDKFSGERPVGDGAWDAFNELCDAFARVMVGWNLEDDKGPIEANADTLDAQGIEFTLALVIGWLTAVDAYTDQLTADTTAQLQGLHQDVLPGFDESQIPMS